jgi:hypothetical protein
VGAEYPSKKSDQTDDRDRDREEADPSDEADPTGAQQETAPLDEPGVEAGGASDVEADGGARDAAADDSPATAGSEGPTDREVSGDGAPGDPQVESVKNAAENDYPPSLGAKKLKALINEIEFNEWLWEVGAETDGGYHATVWVYEDEARLGSFSETEAPTPHDALMSAFMAARDFATESPPSIGQVVPGQVDALLSADGEDMWDPDVASAATIASLLVAHRVAGQRQETWRTREIVDVVQQRVGSVTEEDVPDSVLADVEAEVERRLEPEAV